jgi:hypothetical protein
MEQEIDIVEKTKETAQNLYTVLMQLAQYIEKLKADNEELRKQLGQ